jgi:hypothetical protein
MSQWYYAKDGNQNGPYGSDDMLLAIKTGEIAAQDLVWKDGMPDWKKVKDVPELAAAMRPTQKPTAAAPAPVAQPTHPQPATQPTYQPQGQPLQYQQAYSPSGQLMFTPRAMEMLRQTKPWVRFLAIMGFIITGFVVLAALVMLILGLGGMASGGRGGGAAAGVGVLMALLYVLVAALYFFPSMFLNRYASHINALLSNRREDTLEAALAAQKAFWRLVGIIVLVVVCIYVGIIVIAIVLGGIGAFM